MAYVFILSLLHLAALLSFHKDQDPFYKRFTSPKQDMLIVGSSRAAQGIVPHIINEIIPSSKLYNFSFTKSNSPYGPVYLKAIKNKLKRNEDKEKLFILEVNPWVLATISKNDDPKEYVENQGFLSEILFVNLNPNPFYHLSTYDKAWGNMFMPKRNGVFNLNDDGWLEVNIEYDSALLAPRIREKIEDYRNDELVRSFKSPKRLESLKQTIDYFKSKKGKICLVRLPIHPELLEIENEFYPSFDAQMEEIAQDGVYYLNYVSYKNGMKFNDGNHLNKESSLIISSILANRIKEIYY